MRTACERVEETENAVDLKFFRKARAGPLSTEKNRRLRGRKR